MKKSNLFLLSFITFLCGSIFSGDIPKNYIEYDKNVLNKLADPSAVEKTFNETYKHNTNVNSPVFINTFIDSLEQLENFSVSEEIRPSNVILRVNEELELIDDLGTLIGADFKSAYNKYIKGKMLPVIYFDDENVANKLKIYLDEEFCPLDMAVCSPNPDLLKKVRADGNGRKIRGILDYSNNEKITKVDAVNVTNSSYANAVIISESFATEENIRYIESRLKSVWVNFKNYTDLNFLRLVTDGVYGIVTSEVEAATSAFNYFKNTDKVSLNMNRVPFNIGHRGAPMLSYENSIEGYKLAFEKGASHIEIDVKLTTDNKLVIMHDDEISGITNGSGYVANMSSEQLKQYKITKYKGIADSGEGVNIPFLDDVFKEFKGNGKIIIIEIKDSLENTVPVLKEYIDEYDMYDQVIFIAFDENQLKKTRELMPEIPSATLNNYTNTMFNKTTSDGVVNFNQYNFSSDFNRGVYNKEFDFNLAERGFTGFYRTFDSKSSIYSGANSGILGLTNDYCDALTTFATKLVPIEGEEYIYDSSLPLKDNTFELNYETFDGKISNEVLEATPIFVENQNNGFYKAILQAQFKGPDTVPQYKAIIFSDIVSLKEGKRSEDSVDENEETQEDEPTEETPNEKPITSSKNNNNGAIIGGVVGGIVALAVIVGMIIFRLRRTK